MKTNYKMTTIQEVSQIDYCNFYKNLLVEELAYNFPSRLHYGKCSVIGRIIRVDHKFYLESLTLTSVDRQYQLANGTTKVLLLLHSYKHDPPVAYVEVFGEAVLVRDELFSGQIDSLLPATSNYIQQRISQMQKEFQSTGNDNEDIQLKLSIELNRLNSSFHPAIHVHSLNVIDQPHELITANLRLRKIRLERITATKNIQM